MLLVLVLAQSWRFTPEGVVLATNSKGVTKHTRPGREESLQPVTIPAFKEDKIKVMLLSV